MEADRRKIMTMIALGAGALAGPAAAAAADPISVKLVHHVFFSLKNAGSAEDREQLISGLRTLGGIDVVRGLHIGVPAPTEQRDVVDSSYDVSELMFFDSVADQKIYQDHPVHQAFVAKCSHLWGKVVVYDTLQV
jgi:Stress responsive A/B Barrel Domain